MFESSPIVRTLESLRNVHVTHDLLGCVQVYRGLLKGGVEVAIKVLPTESACAQECFLKEAAVLQSCGGPFIVQVPCLMLCFMACVRSTMKALTLYVCVRKSSCNRDCALVRAHVLLQRDFARACACPAVAEMCIN